MCALGHPFEQAKILPCGHALSPVSYSTMVATQPLACPVCRKEFSQDDVGDNGDVSKFCKKAIQDQLDANRAITIKVISSTKSGSGPWEKVSAQTDWRSVTRIKIDSWTKFYKMSKTQNVYWSWLDYIWNNWITKIKHAKSINSCRCIQLKLFVTCRSVWYPG